MCLVAVFACTAESRSHGKMKALLQRMTLALNKDVIEGRAEIAGFNGEDDCGHGDDSVKYWCPETDSCCSNPASNGNDGDWFCCDADDYPTICASTQAACDI